MRTVHVYYIVQLQFYDPLFSISYFCKQKLFYNKNTCIISNYTKYTH